MDLEKQFNDLERKNDSLKKSLEVNVSEQNRNEMWCKELKKEVDSWQQKYGIAEQRVKDQGYELNHLNNLFEQEKQSKHENE